MMVDSSGSAERVYSRGAQWWSLGIHATGLLPDGSSSKGLSIAHHTALNMLLVVLIAIIISGCETKQGLKIGDPAPGFSATDVYGERISLDRLKGKMVVLYFWRNSCCGDSLRRVEPYYRENRPHNFEMVAVNVGDARGVVISYAKTNGLTFTMLTDEHSLLFGQYRAFGFPTIFIIDKHGIIREKILGDIQTAQLEKLIQRQLDIQKAAEASYEKTHTR